MSFSTDAATRITLAELTAYLLETGWLESTKLPGTFLYDAGDCGIVLQVCDCADCMASVLDDICSIYSMLGKEDVTPQDVYARIKTTAARIPASDASDAIWLTA